MNLSGKVLIIDDEESLRHTLARILRSAGHEVTTARDGREGMACLGGASYDLLYLDVRMPDMHGLEVLKTVHQQYPETPVVLFTAQPDLNSAIQAVREGAVDYMLKPLQPKAILERTQAILAKRELERRKHDLRAQIASLQSELRGIEADLPIPADAPVLESAARFLARGKLRLDLHTRQVWLGDRVVSLPPTSFDCLVVLARHAPRVVEYQTLVLEAQGYHADPREAQELGKWHIHIIRRAIEPDPSHPILIINVRGSGYRLVAD